MFCNELLVMYIFDPLHSNLSKETTTPLGFRLCKTLSTDRRASDPTPVHLPPRDIGNDFRGDFSVKGYFDENEIVMAGWTYLVLSLAIRSWFYYSKGG